METGHQKNQEEQMKGKKRKRGKEIVWSEEKDVPHVVMSMVNNPNPRAHDVVFLVGKEKKEMYASTYFLIKGSPVFAKMFSGYYAERESDFKNPKRIDIPDTTPTAFLEMLYFLYLGFLRSSAIIDFSTALDLLKLSDKYYIEDLADHCSSKMINYFSVDNVFVIASIPSMIFQFMKKEFSTFVKDHTQAIVSRTEAIGTCCWETIQTLAEPMEDNCAFYLLLEWAIQQKDTSSSWTDRVLLKLLDDNKSAAKPLVSIAKLSKENILSLDEYTYVDRELVIRIWKEYISSITCIPSHLAPTNPQGSTNTLAVLTRSSYGFGESCISSRDFEGFYWDDRPVSWSFSLVKNTSVQPEMYGVYLSASWEKETSCMSKRHRQGIRLNGLGIQLCPYGQTMFFNAESVISRPRASRGWNNYIRTKDLDAHLRYNGETFKLRIVRRN